MTGSVAMENSVAMVNSGLGLYAMPSSATSLECDRLKLLLTVV